MAEEIRQGHLRVVARRAVQLREALARANLHPDLPFDAEKLTAYTYVMEALPGPGEAEIIRQIVKDAAQQLSMATDGNIDEEGDPELSAVRDLLPALLGELAIISDRTDAEYAAAGPEPGGLTVETAALAGPIAELHEKIDALADALEDVGGVLARHRKQLDTIIEALNDPQVGVSVFGLLTYSRRSSLMTALELRAQTTGKKISKPWLERIKSSSKQSLAHFKRPFVENREQVGQVEGLLESGDAAVEAGDAFLEQSNRFEHRAFPANRPENLPDLATFQEAEFAPEMVVIPAGEFTMGSPEDEPERRDTEGPQVEVRIKKFALGIYAVTFDEYDAFCRDTDRELPADEDWGRARYPAINVSWPDAQVYCEWLSEKTGAEYRLPSEAEWEYACRAGTETPFWWGDTITPDQANYDGDVAYNGGATGEWRGRTLPVQSFEPNPWKLYQVHGNVWEWCADDWWDTHNGASVDGMPRVLSANWGIEDKVLRGGSWGYGPRYLRSAARDDFSPVNRYIVVGFRVARTLTS